MKSATLGKSTSGAEVTNISRHGFWLLVADEELFVSFNQTNETDRACSRRAGHRSSAMSKWVSRSLLDRRNVANDDLGDFLKIAKDENGVRNRWLLHGGGEDGDEGLS